MPIAQAVAREQVSLDRFELPALPELVASIGQADFAGQLLDLLKGIVGAVSVAFHEARGNAVREICAAPAPGLLPPNDMFLYELKRQFSQAPMHGSRVDVGSVANAAAGRSSVGAERLSRVIICARRGKVSYGLSFVCSSDRLADVKRWLQDDHSIANLLISIGAKHVEFSSDRASATPPLDALPEIERFIVSSTLLSKREGEVCARILYGLSSFGIAVDLGIGRESVMTYRKRAYQRIGISSQRELMMWYLSEWEANAAAPAPEVA